MLGRQNKIQLLEKKQVKERDFLLLYQGSRKGVKAGDQKSKNK